MALFLPLLLAGSPAAAAPTGGPIVLRMASVAPEGTAYARMVKDVASEVELSTNGAVRMKWYNGGIAGDEATVLQRIDRGQLDGLAGALFCDVLAPSLRVTRVVGLFQTREEAVYVARRLRGVLDLEFHKNGFTNLGEGVFGMDILYTRWPIRSMDDLKRGRILTVAVDPLRQQLPRLGIHVDVESLLDWGRLYDEGKADGMFTTPSVALAFQWSTRVKYYTELPIAPLVGCFIVSSRTFDRMNLEQQQVVRAAAAKMARQFDELSRKQDELLLGGLFRKQGLMRSPVSESLREQFLAAARDSRQHLAPGLLPPDLLYRVLGMLADFRAEHPPHP